MSVKLKTRYLNTDLDLGSVHDLKSLGAAFEARGMLLLHLFQREDGSWFTTLETNEQFDSPEANIFAMLTIIESLDEKLRSVWFGCSMREFNVGYDCGDEPRCFTQAISVGTLARLAAVGASLRVTLYPAEME